MTKKITLKGEGRSVSATFQDGENLEEVICSVEGLIRALGYCFDGHLDIVEDSRSDDGK